MKYVPRKIREAEFGVKCMALKAKLARNNTFLALMFTLMHTQVRNEYIMS